MPSKMFRLLSKITLSILLISSNLFNVYSQDTIETKPQIEKWEYELYGNVRYGYYNWQIWKDKRNDIDLEKAVFEVRYNFNEKFSLLSELEIEHGGTGAAVEFDRFEEFGEFEYEIEKGGEVFLEQLYIQYKANNEFMLRAGRVKVPFGLYNFMDNPNEYFTGLVPEMESTIIPTAWTEMGVSVFYNTGDHEFRLAFINGLDGTAFNSANFIRRGNQKRFETVNAEDMALAFRYDFVLNKKSKSKIGISAYGGNTRNNRPKPDLNVDAYLALLDFHTILKFGKISFNSLVIWGNLQNSEAVSNANRNLSNNLNVKRTPIGSQALGASAELAYDISDIFWSDPQTTNHSTSLSSIANKMNIFARFDYYDTHFRTEGLIFDNPRWERSSYSGGLVYHPIEEISLKSHFIMTKLGIPTDNMQFSAYLSMSYSIEN